MKMKNTKAEELWYKIQSRNALRVLSQHYRELLGIPKYGFDNEAETKKCLKKLVKNKKLSKLVNDYIDNCNIDIKIMKEFQHTLIHYLINGYVDVSSVNVSGCELDWSAFRSTGIIGIKIGLDSNKQDIKWFVESQADWI